MGAIKDALIAAAEDLAARDGITFDAANELILSGAVAP
jgi:hypothetical protein